MESSCSAVANLSSLKLRLNIILYPKLRQRKWVNAAGDAYSFTITTPVYNKNCLNSVALNCTYSSSGRGLRANKSGQY